jgi:GAF domain-containing protein
MAGIFLAMNLGYIEIPSISIGNVNESLSFWAVAVTSFFSVGSVIAITLMALLTSLENIINQRQHLTSELDEERKRLESGVVQRTQDLERRLVQIRTAADISRTISALLDQQTLLQQVVDMVKDRFDLYYVGVFLLDEQGKNAILRAGTGDAGQTMISNGHKLEVGGTSMIGWAIANRQARITLDIGEEAIRFENPHLPLTRSELALPMFSGSQVLGAMTVQSTWAEAFDEDDITVLQGIADSLTIALENARLFQQVQENLIEIRALHRQYLAETWRNVAHTSDQLSYTHGDDQIISEEIQLSTIQIPLSLRNQDIGQVTLLMDRSYLDNEEMSFAEAVIMEAALALENARLLEETKHVAERQRLLADVAGKVRASTNVNAVLSTALLELGRTLDASEGLIQLQMQD